jgi:hypothetical protein
MSQYLVEQTEHLCSVQYQCMIEDDGNFKHCDFYYNSISSSREGDSGSALLILIQMGSACSSQFDNTMVKTRPLDSERPASPCPPTKTVTPSPLLPARENLALAPWMPHHPAATCCRQEYRGNK